MSSPYKCHRFWVSLLCIKEIKSKEGRLYNKSCPEPSNKELLLTFPRIEAKNLSSKAPNIFVVCQVSKS